jgi:hypothetical protein
MAGTYYGYAERNASDEINWSQVGKNLTDMLSSEAKIREEKKAAIDKATREYGETLANAPQGEHQGINQWALTYADSAQQARLMQDRLLKSGQLKQRDYLVMRQNITDGTSQAFNLIKEYQAEYNDKMKRYNNGDAQALEQFLMAEAEGFANFNNSELYINPTDFTVNIAKKEKQIVDGKEVYVMSKNPNDFTTVNAMRNRIKGKFDRLDVAKTLQAGVSTLGKEKDAILKLGTLTQGGSITEIIDITTRKDFGVEAKEAVSLYERAESTYLDSIMVQPTNISSILTDYVGMDPNTKESYSYTWDAKKAGGSVILLKNDSAGRPVPEFTEGQKKVAKNALREKFRIMLDREVDIKPTAQAQLQERRPPSEGQLDRAEKKREAKNFAENLSSLLTGNDDQVNSAYGYFGGLGVRLRRDENGIYVKTKRGEVPYLFKNNTPDDLAKAIVSATNVNTLNEDDIVGFSKQFNRGRGLNRTSTGESIISGTAPAEEFTAVINPSIFTSKSEKSSVNLQSILPKGFVVKDIGGLLGNDVEVTAPDGVTKYIYNANMKKDDAEAAVDDLQQFIQLNNVTSTVAPAAVKPAVQSTMKPGRGR